MKKILIIVISFFLGFCLLSCENVSSTKEETESYESRTRITSRNTSSDETSFDSSTNTDTNASTTNSSSKSNTYSSTTTSSTTSSDIVTSSTTVTTSSTSSTSIDVDLVDLSEWHNYPFSDGKDSYLNEDWTYYYNTSVNPNSVARGDAYGVDLCKDKQRLVSPLFSPWEKIEVNIKIKFVSRNSDSYKTIKNKAQLFINCYDKNGNLLETIDVTINKSQVPSNDKNFYTLKIDLYNNQMYYFDINYGNSIESNGSNYYTYAINEISLKGWPYGKKD